MRDPMFAGTCLYMIDVDPQAYIDPSITHPQHIFRLLLHHYTSNGPGPTRHILGDPWKRQSWGLQNHVRTALLFKHDRDL
jgi:hypothetical protein